MSALIVQPEPLADATLLKPAERRVIVLSALGCRSAAIAGVDGVNVSPPRLRPLWYAITKKFGFQGRNPRHTQVELVIRARMLGLLDEVDLGSLSCDVWALVQVLALGKTLNQHALDLKPPIWQPCAPPAHASVCCWHGMPSARSEVHWALNEVEHFVPSVRRPASTVAARAPTVALGGACGHAAKNPASRQRDQGDEYKRACTTDQKVPQ